MSMSVEAYFSSLASSGYCTDWATGFARQDEGVHSDSEVTSVGVSDMAFFFVAGLGREVYDWAGSVGERMRTGEFYSDQGSGAMWSTPRSICSGP